ncbi:MAG: peptidylprolyl isomerase [Pirellulales bacterium]
MFLAPRSWLAVLVCVAVGSAQAHGQDTQPQKKSAAGTQNTTAKQATQSVDAKAAQAQFDQVFNEWREMLAQLAELQERYQKAPENGKAAIEKEYRAIAAKGEKLSERLKRATEAAYAADPANKEVSQLLGRMAVTALRDDQYEEAGRLARLGLEQKPTDQQFAGIAANAAFNLNEFSDVAPLVSKAADGRPLPKEIQELLANARQYIELWKQEQQILATEAKADDLPRVKLQTTKGEIVLELFENQAPNTVANFISLVEKGFYDGLLFHRVLAGFMAQGGDPTGTGSGGPGYQIKDEVDRKDTRMHFRGSLSMAKAPAPDTGGSQFFLTFKPTPHLNGLHTVFGRVIEGFDVVAKINRVEPPKTGGPPANADKIVKATVVRKRNHEYKPETLPD